MTREETRRENARKLAATEEKLVDFARRLEMEPSQVTQLIGQNFKKNIGNSIARRIERAYDRPEGWLDIEHPDVSLRLVSTTAPIDAAPASNTDDTEPSTGPLTMAEIHRLVPGAMPVKSANDEDPALTHIPKVRLRLSAGISGFEVEPERFDGSTTTVPTNWIERNGYRRDQLIAITVKGESMETTLYEGDLVVINTDDKRLVDGSVYAVNYEGEAVVKRLSRDAGQWWLTSDNPDQRKFQRKLCKGHECIVVGKVVRRESDRL